MARFYVEITVILIGFFALWRLFYRIPSLPKSAFSAAPPKISVIVPARNEEKTLPLLLSSLARQTLTPVEILVVDDASEDGTAKTARAYGARVLTPPEKPRGWVGKNWACQFGADSARGEVLLFLDADVTLSPDALNRFAAVYADCGGTLSVQPYHAVERAYEQFALFFNLTQISANGAALKVPAPRGLFGPVVWIPHTAYAHIGGHAAVKGSIVEDIALGARLRENGLPIRLYIGDADVRFRMYPDGFRSLLQGFTKNLASGAAKTRPGVFAAVFFLYASLASVPLHLFESLFAANWPHAALYAALYVVWASVLFILSRRIGRFSAAACALYPFPLLVFFGVFLLSVFKRMFRLNVTWKGRAIKPGR